MTKFIVKIDNTFFEFERISNKELQITLVKDPLNKIYTNIPLLYADTNNENSAFLVFDETENDEVIENAGTSLLNSKSYFCKIKNINGQKLAWYVKKTEIINLFKEFTFNKIIPLDIVLYKANVGLSGIVTDPFIYLRRFKDIYSITNKDTLIFDLNSDFDLFLGICEDLIDVDKKIITDKNLEKEIEQKYNFEIFSWKEIEKYIETEKVFVIEDKYSDNYQSKIYRIILLLSSAVMVSVSPYLLWKSYKNKTESSYYETILNKQKQLLSYIKKQERKYKTDLLYKWYKPIYFSNFYKRISFITKQPGILSVIYKEDNKGSYIKSIYTITIDNIDDFKSFYKKNQKYVKSFKINDKTEQVNLKLVLKNKK